MILHLIPDEKFADYVICQFASSNMKSHLVLVTSGRAQMVKEYAKTQVLTFDSEAFQNLLQNLSQYSAVIFHGLFWPWQERVLNAIPSTVKIAWMFWGGEIYGRKNMQGKFLSHSSKVLLNLRNLKQTISLRGIRFTKYHIPIDYLMKIDYCLTDMSMECEYANRYLHHSMQMLWYNYYSIEDMIGETLLHECCAGNGIFIGNSATIENNHLDVFFDLKHLPIGGHKLVVPLSYGALWYKNVIHRVGHILFGRQFQPLFHFIERSDYNHIMLSCNTMIMPHYRAQAQGNIITGLWLGMRVYLYEQNFAYQYFRGLGVKIYSINEDMNKHNPNLFAPMTREDIAHNRSILLHVYGQEAIMNAVRNIVNTLDK